MGAFPGAGASCPLEQQWASGPMRAGRPRSQEESFRMGAFRERGHPARLNNSGPLARCGRDARAPRKSRSAWALSRERGHLARLNNSGPLAHCGRDARAPREGLMPSIKSRGSPRVENDEGTDRLHSPRGAARKDDARARRDRPGAETVDGLRGGRRPRAKGSTPSRAGVFRAACRRRIGSVRRGQRGLRGRASFGWRVAWCTALGPSLRGSGRSTPPAGGVLAAATVRGRDGLSAPRCAHRARRPPPRSWFWSPDGRRLPRRAEPGSRGSGSRGSGSRRVRVSAGPGLGGPRHPVGPSRFPSLGRPMRCRSRSLPPPTGRMQRRDTTPCRRDPARLRGSAARIRPVPGG